MALSAHDKVCLRNQLAARQEQGRRSRPRQCRLGQASVPYSWSRPLHRHCLLILGGTSEASALSRRLADEPDVAAILSLAGATATPAPLRQSRDASAASAAPKAWRRFSPESASRRHPRDPSLRCAHVRERRRSLPDDRYAARRLHPSVVDTRGRRPLNRGRDNGCGRRRSWAKATDSLSDARRLQLAAFARAPQHRYIVRAIDRPAEIGALPDCKLILARGPFSLADEAALMRNEGIEALVTKNSGGRATYAKIEAARALGIEVVIAAPAARARSRNAARSRRCHDLDRRSSTRPHKRAASASMVARRRAR